MFFLPDSNAADRWTKPCQNSVLQLLALWNHNGCFISVAYWSVCFYWGVTLYSLKWWNPLISRASLLWIQQGLGELLRGLKSLFQCSLLSIDHKSFSLHPLIQNFNKSCLFLCFPFSVHSFHTLFLLTKHKRTEAPKADFLFLWGDSAHLCSGKTFVVVMQSLSVCGHLLDLNSCHVWLNVIFLSGHVSLLLYYQAERMNSSGFKGNCYAPLCV